VLDTNAASVRFDPDVVLERVSDFRHAETETPTILDALSEETVVKLSAKGFLLNLSAGQLLTEKSLKQRELFIIIEGGFEVHDGDRRLRLIGPGDVIGEIGFFGSSGRRTASVTAVTDGQVLALRRHFVDELMQTDPAGAAEILFQLARALADRQYL
jgi:CRP-like cAMP-binding protein